MLDPRLAGVAQAQSMQQGVPQAQPAGDGQQHEVITAILKDYGWSDQQIQQFWAMDDQHRQQIFGQLISKPPQAVQNVQQYLAQQGMDQNKVMSLTPHAIQALAQQSMMKTGKI